MTETGTTGSTWSVIERVGRRRSLSCCLPWRSMCCDLSVSSLLSTGRVHLSVTVVHKRSLLWPCCNLATYDHVDMQTSSAPQTVHLGVRTSRRKASFDSDPHTHNIHIFRRCYYKYEYPAVVVIACVSTLCSERPVAVPVFGPPSPPSESLYPSVPAARSTTLRQGYIEQRCVASMP